MSEGAVDVLYFAWVRETVGRDEERVTLPEGATTVADLVAELAGRGGEYGEALAQRDKLRVAVNQVHAGFDHPVRPGDEVALFPPVTGG